MALNPNWPLIETAWGPYWDANGGEIPPDRYVEVKTIGQFATGRGRQYQLDQVQAGTCSMVLPNQDGSLDPDNTAGPYAGRIKPFQPIRRRAQWPPTINLLTQAQATGGDVGGQPLGVIDGSDTGPRILTDTDGTGGSFVASGTAWQGATVAQFAVSSTAVAAQWICYTAQPGVLPGQAYTVQLRVRNVTPGTTVQVAAGFRTRTATDAAATTAVGSTASLVGSATAAWTQITLTATAAATSAALFTGVQIVTAPGATAQVQVDGWQLEKGSSASAWVQPGVWSPVMSQFVEKWPATWLDGGTRGVVQPTGVDSFALLSQFTLPDPLTAEIQSHSPRFLFRLDDPAGSTTVADATGTYTPAPVAHGKYGAGTVTFGTSVTATDTVNGVFAGSAGPVMHVQNASPATNLLAAASFIALDAVGIKGPALAGSWTRVLAFRYTGPATRTQSTIMWSCFDAQRPVIGNTLEWLIAPDGTFQIVSAGPVAGSGQHSKAVPEVEADDGNWHIGMVAYDAAADGLIVRLDGYAHTFSNVVGSGNWPTLLVSDALGNYVDRTNGGGTVFNWAGDLSFCAEFPVAFTLTDCDNLYSAWKQACAGESTDARYRRILRYSGYGGATRLQAGQTTDMGPAAFAGQDALTALQGCVDTEGGAHFVDAAGTVTFQARTARYNQLVPTVVFGERSDLGEYPYEDCQPDFDSTHLGGIAQVTQDGTGQVFTATDSASVKSYFPRTLTRTVNAVDPLECQDAANYIKSRYAQPSTRVAALKLHPSAYPALWPVCLSLEQGVRVRVMRRPLGAPAIQIECFVEKLDWTQDDKGEAVLILQCSRADTLVYGRFAAWHTTLSAGAAIGATSITVKNSQDNTNPLSSQLAAGQQLILGFGGSVPEPVTVLSVGATAPGWTTAVINLTAPTIHTHTTGGVVCEPMPAGVTDPAAFDAVSAFDAVTFAY
ncbi:hypothetical protein V2S66_33050 [Streptomyces sp. V4-01]|uniref:LamG domain-containing protein n=1 Tax=Actinacidiphila polyblastidii TaxID=3110430 RepID=A0ABU7PLR9_9ACTN|nr:hypothetical protein [Streptomyces sp. V4-01]